MFPNQNPTMRSPMTAPPSVVPKPPAPPMAGAAPGMTQPAPGPNGMADQMKECLGKLSPEELSELDDYVTPRFQELMAKAFGPEVGQMLDPFVQDDEDNQFMDDQGQETDNTAAGPEAIPYSNTPINQVKAMGYDDNQDNNARV